MECGFWKNVIVIGLLLISAFQCQNTDDCQVNYGCLLKPDGCQDSECDYIIKWKQTEPHEDFLISTNAQPGSWVAIGFSDDQEMGNDSVVMCKVNAASNFYVQTYYNEEHSTEIVDPSQKSLGLSHTNATLVNGRFLCSFKRAIKDKSYESEFFDLNTPFYLLVASGHLKQNDEPHKHNDQFFSDEKIDFRAFKNSRLGSKFFIKLHACLMLITWLVCSTIGILFARYYKNSFHKSKICGFEVWFAVHRPMMITACLVSIASFLIIFYEKKWTWVHVSLGKNFIHSVFGSLTIILTIIQPIIALFRPDKNDPNRYKFNWSHRILGISTFVFSNAAICLGILMLVKSNLGWQILIGWLVWLFIFIVFIELASFYEKRKIAYEMLETDQHTIQFKNSNYDRIKWALLVVHLILAVSIVTALAFIIIKEF